jgi:tetratricopeptide (TPR) repeat protein/O-antigen ligase
MAICYTSAWVGEWLSLSCGSGWVSRSAASPGRPSPRPVFTVRWPLCASRRSRKSDSPSLSWPALALLAVLDGGLDFASLSAHERLYGKAILPFVLILVLATLFSPVPGQSLVYSLDMLVLILLAGILAVSIRNWAEWQAFAGWILGAAAVLPVILGLVKLADVGVHLGGAAAISYRLHPTEMGGANLIARSILAAAPLGLAFWIWIGRSPQKKALRLGLLALQALILLILLWARSWEGFFAWLAALGVFIILWLWPSLSAAWRRFASRPFLKWGIVGAGIVVFSGLAVYSIQLATVFNATSYNGRIIHWKSAYIAMLDHPLLGGGPGNEYLLAATDGGFLPFEHTREIVDDPLYVLAFRSGITRVHAHNLFLEIGAFTGIGGLLAFAGSVLVLLWIGHQIWKQGDARKKLFGAACLAGIVGALAWGMLDVLRAAPPFFSSPVWVMIGLLLALVRTDDQGSSQTPLSKPGRTDQKIGWIALLAAILVILIPSMASNQYASGFLAYQDHRWQEAGERLQWAARLDPLSAHYRWMLASVKIETGQIAEAAEELRAATKLKKDFSPYLMDSARLAWLQGDMTAASNFYEQAIASDPLETWERGSRAELALLRSYQGDNSQAVGLLKRTLELRPALVEEPYWVNVMDADGAPILAIDPVYTNGARTSELELRLLERLGKSDLTARHFNRVEPNGEPIRLSEVLAALERDFQANKELKDQAVLLLAAKAEVARLAGYTAQAEQAYQDFQATRPESAYGFRDLGKLYRSQRRLAEAQAMLEKAIEISPKNIDSNLQLVSLQLDQGKVQHASNTFRELLGIASGDSFHFSLFNLNLLEARIRTSQASGDSAEAQQTLAWLAYIRGQPEDYLQLAGSQPEEQAVESCWSAYAGLINQWVRPYDPRLWQVAGCVAKTSQSDQQIMSRLNDFQSPFVNYLLAGQVAFQRNDFEKAISQYHAAAEISPNEGAPFYFLGEANRSLGQIELAEHNYRRAAELSPLESLPLLSLGKLYQSTGNPEAALQTFEAAVLRTPGWDEAQLLSGNLYLAMGQFDQADQHYQQAQRLAGFPAPGLVYDFVALLAQANFSETLNQGFIKADYFTIDGERESTIFMHPASWTRYALQLPQSLPSERLWLSFAIGMSPDSWSQAGDGVEFIIRVHSNSGEETVFTQTIDPKNDPSDQRWHNYSIDLTPYAGQDIEIQFETNAGPAGDNQFDWAGWGNPRIIAPLSP